ncbi:MAG: DUF4159 domain-containing protein [Flavobacteriales bacterium]
MLRLSLNSWALSGTWVAMMLVLGGEVHAQSGEYSFAVLKYRGGGDYYANPTALPNLISFANEQTGMAISEQVDYVGVGDPELLDFPFVHMTGHGNVVFSNREAENIRTWLRSGGFLHISDNYGMNPYVRREMKKVFPTSDWVEIPFDHPVYHQVFDFDRGLPKIHEHDNQPPRGYGLIVDGRLVCFYDYECDLSDGWEDGSVHRDPESVRREALQMGVNLITYALSGAWF